MGSLVEETVNKLVRDSINLITGVSGFAIRANQNHPRPEGQYATVNTTSLTGIGWDYSEMVDRQDLDVDEKIRGQRDILFTINVLRDNAKTVAENIRTGLARTSIIELFNAAGCGLGSRSDVSGATEALETGWESRATFSFSLNTVQTDEELIRSIRAVDIQGEFQFRGSSTNVTIEVP